MTHAIVDAQVRELAPAPTPTVCPVSAYLERLGPGSRRTQRVKLDAAARIMGFDRAETVPWAQLPPAAFTKLRRELLAQYAVRTANAAVAAIRGVLREAWRAGQLDQETRERMLDGFKTQSPGTVKAGRSLDVGELVALFACCAADESTKRGARDAALLSLLYGAGLRVGEAVAVELEDLDLEAEEVHVRRGKGDRDRTVPLASGAAERLEAWLQIRPGGAGPVLRAVLRGDRISGPLTTRGALRAVERLAGSCGSRPFTPHDLRRSYAGDLLDRGADLATVQQLMGHADPKTTAGYDRRPAEARKRAARLLAIPT